MLEGLFFSHKIKGRFTVAFNQNAPVEFEYFSQLYWEAKESSLTRLCPMFCTNFDIFPILYFNQQMSLFYHAAVDKDTLLLLSQHIFSKRTICFPWNEYTWTQKCRLNALSITLTNLSPQQLWWELWLLNNIENHLYANVPWDFKRAKGELVGFYGYSFKNM